MEKKNKIKSLPPAWCLPKFPKHGTWIFAAYPKVMFIQIDRNILVNDVETEKSIATTTAIVGIYVPYNVNMNTNYAFG